MGMLENLMSDLTNEQLEAEIDALKEKYDKAVKLIEQQSNLLKDANELILIAKTHSDFFEKQYDKLLNKVTGKL